MGTCTCEKRINEAVLTSTQNLCFRAKIRKMYTHINPSFTIQKWVVSGCKLHGRVSMMFKFERSTWKHIRTKVTPDFQLTYSKNGGNLGSESK